ncbi:hypothetical protein COZ82_02710 [Candidatus Kaiserbacteria bacterium CG_4_8_14_3_um_filter_38_9]|uniref:Uncharacterized protein n=1 Tax=Candidatus Kaiserbacteria bacterium CG_4_8_14_3_um_filter_38_9 TaxID=1974599 RepID=A0A2M7INE6_9BACT|nr:MAG: hypothetical protein COZ82_02710 [Candidatus Kaiserbacteria bacterium CG_4_8_14_3_um_filter_38_9]
MEQTKRVRKAPTVLSKTVNGKRKINLAFLPALMVFFVLVIVSVGIGFMDKGSIDVVATVNDRNEKINRGEVRNETTGEVVTERVPVQNTDVRPNGGLKQSATPIATPAPEIKAEPVSTTSATATETTE